jgi:hypothetical protein
MPSIPSAEELPLAEADGAGGGAGGALAAAMYCATGTPLSSSESLTFRGTPTPHTWGFHVTPIL